MPETQHASKSSTRVADPETITEIPSKNVDSDKIKQDLDDLLDEIDDVLATNAEEFVGSYVQAGGQ